MKTQTTLISIAAAALALTPALGFAQGGPGGPGAGQPKDRAQIERGQRDMDRDRLHDRDRISDPSRDRDRDRDQDRTHAPDFATFGENRIYGGEMMTDQERNQYREQLQLIGSDEKKRTRFLAQHREEMQARAKAKGVKLDDTETPEESE